MAEHCESMEAITASVMEKKHTAAAADAESIAVVRKK